MHLDHISFAAGQDGIDRTAERLSQLLGEKFADGGIHPRFGTTNRVLPLAEGQYIEVVAVLDHPASDKAPFGQAVRARSEAGGGWLSWVIAVDDITPLEKRLARDSVVGSRHRPDGHELRWRQIGIRGLQSDAQLPFFVEWDVAKEDHPSYGATGAISLHRLEISGSPERVAQWMGVVEAGHIEGIEIDWVATNGNPGISAAIFTTPHGTVRI